MGTVEVALERGQDDFERVVALKRLLPEGARDPRHKEMFLREARLAALLAHPNVVHAFAFGELCGELFMAMEYVEGEPLSHVLHTAEDGDRKLAPELVAFILAEVCDGLHAAHELRDGEGQPLHVVHRDVSPHNVMIAYDGRVKLLDFGVAKFEAGGNETRTGEVKGKMSYMSPEQALGEKLDRRSDLFSIGAVLFECLTGNRMWGSGTDLDVMRKLALESPPRLDAAMKHVPRGLVELHARLVSRDPGRRPSTAMEVARELRAVAAARGPAPDAEAVRSLMYLLFGRQALGRRAQLTESLVQAAPSRIDELRRSLDPLAEGGRPMSAAPFVVEALTPGSRISDRSRTPLVPAVLFLVILGAVAAAIATARSRHPAAASSPLTTTTPVATSTAVAPFPIPTSTPNPTATPPPTASAPVTTSRGPTPPAMAWSSAPISPFLARRPSAAQPPSAAPTKPPDSAQPPSPAPTRLPDVDPTPF